MYSCLTELFEIELNICIKMYLVLKTNKGWYAIKTNQPTNQPTYQPTDLLNSVRQFFLEGMLYFLIVKV